MKKIISKVLCAVSIFTLCGCTSQKENSNSSLQPSNETTSAQSSASESLLSSSLSSLSEGLETVSYTIYVEIVGEGVKKGATVNLVQNDEVKYTGTTDRKGKVVIEALKGEYQVVVASLNAGLYQTSKVIASSEKDNKIIISSKLIEGETPAGTEYYRSSVIYDYTFNMSDGTTLSISQAMEGKKAVVLNFWGITCPYCVKEMPDLNTFNNQYKDEMTLIAINGYMRDTNESINKFLEENEYSIKSTSLNHTFPAYFGIEGYPTTIVIDRYGRYAKGYSGYISSLDGFKNLVTPYLADNYSPLY